jgi:hypothetical protein
VALVLAERLAASHADTPKALARIGAAFGWSEQWYLATRSECGSGVLASGELFLNEMLDAV